MYTEADKARDDAEEHMQDAIKDLSKIVVDRCDGTEEYMAPYVTMLTDTMTNLIRTLQTYKNWNE